MRFILAAVLCILALSARAQNVLFPANPGDMIVKGATTWGPVPGGTAGCVLMSNGPIAVPIWSCALPLNFSLPPLATNRVWGNVSGVQGIPTQVSASQFLDTIDYDIQHPLLPGSTLYKGTDNTWHAAPPATAGWVWTSRGPGAIPQWATPGAPISNLIVGTTGVASGTSNGILFNNGGVLGNTTSTNDAFLVTDGAGVPSFSTTLPAGVSLSLLVNRVFVGNSSNVATGVALSGDCVIVAAGAITCTKTGGVAFGTTAIQNANNVSITGGSVNGTTIGASARSTGAFTTFDTTGRAGVGTASPGVALDVIGGVRAIGTTVGATAVASSIIIDYDAVFGARIISFGADTSTKGNFSFVGTTSNASSISAPLVIDSSGNVGIGTTSPAAQLHTTGSVRLAGMSGIGVSGCVGNDAFGNLTLGAACSGTGLPSGGTIGQIPIKYDATNGHVVWVSDDAYDIAADATTDCTGAAPTVLSIVAAAFKTIKIPQGCTIQVNANDTLLPSTTVRMACGATIQVNNTFTLTIKGAFIDPGPCRLFTYTGSGKVVGIAKVRPEWWGARVETTFTGTGSGTNLTTTAVTGTITPGDTIRGTGVPGGTTIVSQTSGTTGGAGVYVTSGATTSSSNAIISALADSGAPIQLAINSVQAAIGQSTDAFSIKFVCGTYDLTTGITFTPTFLISWDISGCGPVYQNTGFLCRTTLSGSCVTIAGTSVGFGLSKWSLKNVTIQNETQSSGGTVGLTIGSSGTDIIVGLSVNPVENISVNGFATQILVQNAQWIAFDRIFISPNDLANTEKASSNGLTITNTASPGADTGTIYVNRSKLVGSGHGGTGTGNAVLVQSNTPFQTGGVTPAAIAGIHFNDNEWYGGTQQLNITTGVGGGRISDIWVNPGNQFEASVNHNNGIAVTNGGGSTVNLYSIHINGSYFSGYGHTNPIKFTGTVNSVLFGLQVNNNFISNPVDIGIDVLCNGAGGTLGNAYGVNITGNQIVSPTVNTGIDAIYVDSCKQIVASNNSLIGGTIGTPSRRSTVLTNSCDYVAAVGNNGGGLTSGAAWITGGSCTHAGVSGSNIP